MRVIVCGSRTYTNAMKINKALEEIGPVELYDGGAQGADAIAAIWRCDNSVDGFSIEAEWNLYGRAAGPIRNKKMLDFVKPDVVLAFGTGIGTRNMVKQAKLAGVEVKEYT